MKSFHDGKVILHGGDCMNVLRTMPADSIDAVVTDPPYHLTSIVKRFGYRGKELPLSQSQKRWNKTGAAIATGPSGQPSPNQYGRLSKGFMGKQWDGGDIAFRPELWAEVLRVLKPGGHMVCFGGTRTYHRMVCAIEDAGFEVRDQLAWVYGSGFPKSHDVSKGIDRAAGAEREVVGKHQSPASSIGKNGLYGNAGADTWRDTIGEREPVITAPATTAARQWQGWGTALKPAFEPVCLARKPLSESTVAANVLRWGTGALNIDGTRIAHDEPLTPMAAQKDGDLVFGQAGRREETTNLKANGRWPANLCHDGSPEVLAGFPDATGATSNGRNGIAGIYQDGIGIVEQVPGYADSGSAARFFASFPQDDTANRFHYTSKADADDRLGSRHPTIKPVTLMCWLVRLICPKGGTCLDPFAGTGTTGAAAFIEGCRAVLIEREAEYLADIERRMGMLLSGQDERTRKLATPDPHDSLPLFAVMP